MSQLIDYTYFIGDINLPAQVLTGSNPPIDAYIERYEKEALMNLLGYDLYKAFKAEIDTSPQAFSAVWSGLVSGEEYTVGSYLRKWEGLVNAEKCSLIAYLVYFHYLKDQVTSYESVGAVTGLAENASRAAADGLIVNAWNRYVELRNEAIEYITANLTDYPKLIFQPEEKINTFGL
jgi:hypothetical protein